MFVEVVNPQNNSYFQQGDLSPQDKLPTERSGMRMASDCNYIYVIGGYSPGREPVLAEEVWRFNILTDNWELMDVPEEGFPEELASFASCFFGDSDLVEFYMFGGTAVPFGLQASNSVTLLKRLKNGTFIWKRLKTIGDVPIKQYGSSLVFNEGKFYVLGGTTGWVYNLEVRSLEPVHSNEKDLDTTEMQLNCWKWTLLHNGSGIDGRYKHEALVVDNEIVLIGGGTSEWASSLVKLLVFNIPSRSFRMQITLPDMTYGYPKSRLYHSCVKFGNHAYLLGGCTEKTVVQNSNDRIMRPKLLRDCWELDLKKWCWRRLRGQLNQETCFHAATITPNGCLYVFGGTTDDKFERRTNQLQRFWITPPSLFHLAARAVIAAHPVLLKRFHNLTATNILSHVLTMTF